MITFNQFGEAIYNGINTGITKETLQDIEKNTGISSTSILENLMNQQQQIQENREIRINSILNNPNENSDHTQK